MADDSTFWVVWGLFEQRPDRTVYSSLEDATAAATARAAASPGVRYYVLRAEVLVHADLHSVAVAETLRGPP